MLEEYEKWFQIVIALDTIGLPWLKGILYNELGAPEDGGELYKYFEQYQAILEEAKITPSQKKHFFPQKQ